MPCSPYIDSPYGRVFPVTSTTRPTGSALYEGLLIYETDTDRLRVWNGAAWVFSGCYSASGRAGVILTDAAQTVGTSAGTNITWGTEVSDVDGWVTAGSATLTVPSGWDGRYAISYSATMSGTGGTQGAVAILINSVVVAASAIDNGAYSAPSIGLVRALAAGGTVIVQVYQNSGANRDFVSRLEIEWLGG